MVFGNVRQRELYIIVAETLTVCGVSVGVLDELLAIRPSMQHNVNDTNFGTVSATELATMGSGKRNN